MTADRLARLEALEAKAKHRGGVVIVWPDGVRDGWGRPAKVEGAAVLLVMPARAMTPEQIEAARL
ncbi:hypothetical protein [Deinococcus sp. UYEF24]